VSDDVTDFVIEPHRAICSDRKSVTLNMVALESEEARQACTVLAKEHPESIVKEIGKIETLVLAQRHRMTKADIDPKKLYRTFVATYERQPENFEGLLGIRGVGPKTIRALSLVAELIYGKPSSYRDPARFSFAHGGKDGTPFPVDRKVYDTTIDAMRKAISAANVGNQEQRNALRRLSKYFEV
jgi:hypothetical protein